MRTVRCIFLVILFPLTAWAQEVPGEGTRAGATLQITETKTKTWTIFGHVTDLKGKPLGGVDVHVDVGVGISSARSLKTDLQGAFQTEFTLNATYSRLDVTVVANKSGYTEANEAVEFGSADTTSNIDIVLRELTQSPDELPLATLVTALGPRLRDSATPKPGGASGHKEWARGSEELLDRHEAARAVPLLTKAVERAPKCVECRLLLTLSMFEAGSWAGASRQLDEALELNDAAASKRPEPALIAGVLEAWRGHPDRSAGFLAKALEMDPGNAVALQEMGRALVAQSKWEAADQYLEKALRAGAGDDARLLRIRALLQEGDTSEAARVMDRFMAGHDLKSLSPTTRELYTQLDVRRRLLPYGESKSVLTESIPELLKTAPELTGIRLAPDQTELPGLLKKVGEGVEAFFKNFPNTASTERVHQELLGKDGGVAHSLDQAFQYLLLSSPDKWGLGLEEHRNTPQGGIAAQSGLNQGLMLTGGFAAASLLFHPAYQDGAAFRYLGRQSLGSYAEVVKTNDGKLLLLRPDGTWTPTEKEPPPAREVHVIAFAQKPELARTMEWFKTEKGSALILVQGLAWVDPANFQIVRLRTDLLAPQPKISLERQTTEIRYQEVAFKEVATALWLPQEVDVTVELRGRVYRNQHHYSEFKLFNVETKEQRKKQAASPAPIGQP